MENKQPSHRIIGKIIVRAEINNTSPLLIGKGEGESSDTDIMLWHDGRPYIPGSSLAGVLRKRFCEWCSIKDKVQNKKEIEKFWGTDDSKKQETFQSHIIFDDLLPQESSAFEITIRDGVRIEHKTSIAANQGKYDYQLLEPGVTFDFKAEITIREGMDSGVFRKIALSIGAIIKNNDFRIGALTSGGFGKIDVKAFEAHHYDFKSSDEDKAKSAAIAWFDYLKNGTPNDAYLIKDVEPFVLHHKTFAVVANFKIKSALITGSYTSNPNLPDKSQLTSNGKYVLSGKAIRGALRHRTVKILNTLNCDGDECIKPLMGYVDPKNPKTRAVKSRLRIEESHLDSFEAMTQNRIRIDRFTGGVMDGALFNSAPVWQKGENTLTLSFAITNPEKWECSLLMQLLKDLWLEDLPIGGEKNVGRGVLIGQSAAIYEDGQEIARLKGQSNDFEVTGDMKKLNTYNDTQKLIEPCEKKTA
jgi:CRISPR/Cas system CSM-associated protein Csm3 (group 7 of RAMP superfamily)